LKIQTLTSNVSGGFSEISHILISLDGWSISIISTQHLIVPWSIELEFMYIYLTSIGFSGRLYHSILKNLSSKSMDVDPIRSSPKISS
jgi:hypothetical protein